MYVEIVVLFHLVPPFFAFKITKVKCHILVVLEMWIKIILSNGRRRIRFFILSRKNNKLVQYLLGMHQLFLLIQRLTNCKFARYVQSFLNNFQWICHVFHEIIAIIYQKRGLRLSLVHVY